MTLVSNNLETINLETLSLIEYRILDYMKNWAGFNQIGFKIGHFAQRFSDLCEYIKL